MKVLTYSLAAMLLFIFIACNGVLAPESKETEVNRLAKEINAAPDSIKFAAPPGNDEQRQGQPQPKIDWDKKIVKNGSLNIEVKKVDEFNTTLRDIVKRSGGYIAQEEQNSSNYKIENSVTIKVPVDQFESVMNGLTANQDKINERKINSEDVTGEVIDTKSRIEAKKQVRERYLDLLKQARNMGEILQVESEINDIQQQIEAAAGRVNYLTHAAAMSTIHITYYQIIGEQIQQEKEPSFGTRMLQAFRSGATWIGEFVIFLINIWPLFLSLFVILIVIKRIRPKTKAA